MQRIGLIGTRGHYAAVLRELQTLRERAEVVAYCGAEDDVAPLAEWCRTHSPGATERRHWTDVLDVGVSAVMVCGPFEQHAAMTVAAIGRGVHVLAEKPVALTLGELDNLKEVCRERPAVHLAGMMFSRYTPGFYTAWKLIREGAVGDVRHVDARKSYKLGARPAYYATHETYGGTIPWVGSHAIDWTLWFYGETARFTSVCATHSSVGNGGNGTMEATASCLFQLEGGRTASVSIDYLRPANAPTHGDDWARIVGTRGVMEVRPESVVLVGEGVAGEVSCPYTPLGDFVDHIDGRRRSLLDAAQTLALARACLLARQSADERRVVPFEQ